MTSIWTVGAYFRLPTSLRIDEDTMMTRKTTTQTLGRPNFLQKYNHVHKDYCQQQNRHFHNLMHLPG